MQEFSHADSLTGKTSKQNEEDKLMSSVMQNDKETVEDGKIVKEALNQSVSSFTPDLMIEQHVNNFSLAENIYGPKLLSVLAGYDDSYVKKNINIPEFQRELKKRINEKLDHLKEKKLVSKDNTINMQGIKLAALTMYTEELDKLTSKGLVGEKYHKKTDVHGEKQDTKRYKKGDRYRDIAIKKTAKKAIRRGHTSIQEEDLMTFEKQSKGQVNIILGIDSSGSMKGKKIELSKKAGIALAFKAIQEKDKVGLISFGTEVKETVEPTHDFMKLITTITKAKASKETNLSGSIEKSIEIFPAKDETKHLTIITDALPTTGKDPQKETLEAVGKAKAAGITVSVVGINLDEKGVELAKRMVEIGEGKFHIATDIEELDQIILEDYYSVS